MYLGLLLASILINYAIGIALSDEGANRRKPILLIGVAINLGFLAYFKYANFFVDNFNWVFETSFHIEKIFLPLAISFFTFQQIAYLVDAYRGETREYDFLHYCLFVTFFPQLIAGPIVHHKEMLPQFAKDWIYRINFEQLSLGVSIFFIGLFKKVVLADGVAVYATPVFNAATGAVDLSFFEAWLGVLAYTFQIYFDFSGYSDMAIGLGCMFGISLPLNFHSPYKAASIIDFWRRWHITLSRFLRDYLYIPLGGNRAGRLHRYRNLMLTMLLGGLWHGAAWTFLIWGGLHGLYLVIYHGWRRVRGGLEFPVRGLERILGLLLTFGAVVFAWVFFRADTFSGALSMLHSMSGLNGISLDSKFPNGVSPTADSPDPLSGIILLLICFLVAWGLPNTIQWVGQCRVALIPVYWRDAFATGRTWKWRPNMAWGAGVALVAAIAILSLNQVSEFLYFQF